MLFVRVRLFVPYKRVHNSLQDDQNRAQCFILFCNSKLLSEIFLSSFTQEEFTYTLCITVSGGIGELQSFMGVEYS